MPAALNNAVDPGSLRHTISIVAFDGPRNASREKTERLVARVRASVVAMSGQARYMTQQYAERASHVITIRHRDGISAGMKVRFGPHVYGLVYPLDPEYAGRWLHLLCMEEAATATPGGGP